jgi:VWFA-related protein
VGTKCLLLLASFIVVFVALVQGQERPAFRAGVDLVTLGVTVTDGSGHRVGDLDAKEFDVLENGVPQELTIFSHATTPLSVSLLLDSSASMEQQMVVVQHAASEFLGQLRPGDVAQVVDFDSRVEVVEPFTDDRRALRAAVERIRAGGSTTLYNAIYIALRQLDRLRAGTLDQLRREVIVVLSDGEDTSSLLTFDELLDVAKRSHTVIYAISLQAETPHRTPRPMSGEYALRRLADNTGGRLFTLKRAEDLASVYLGIAGELTSQYVLGYLSTNSSRDGQWRTVAIRVRRPNLRARTKPGYYAPPPTAPLQ